MIKVCGVDYGMSSPVLCCHSGKEWNFKNCEFHFLTDKKKAIFPDKKFFGEYFKKPDSSEERFEYISNFFIDKIKKYAPDLVVIEGYSYGSRGKVFEIGENTGLLKNKLWISKIPFEVVAPPTVKKFATGRGNSKKPEMVKAFQDQTGYPLLDFFSIKDDSKDLGPADDIADAYFLAQIAQKKL